MTTPDHNDNAQPQKGHMPAADTGNASNPSPHSNNWQPDTPGQLLDKKAETYLREGSNIEDMPDPQEELNAEETMDKENNEKGTGHE